MHNRQLVAAYIFQVSEHFLPFWGREGFWEELCALFQVLNCASSPVTYGEKLTGTARDANQAQHTRSFYDPPSTSARIQLLLEKLCAGKFAAQKDPAHIDFPVMSLSDAISHSNVPKKKDGGFHPDSRMKHNIINMKFSEPTSPSPNLLLSCRALASSDHQHLNRRC